MGGAFRVIRDRMQKWFNSACRIAPVGTIVGNGSDLDTLYDRNEGLAFLHALVVLNPY